MSNKELKTRIQMKNDTVSAWDKASENAFIPLLGEPIFYKDGDMVIQGQKVGDGVHTPNELNFIAVNEAQTGLAIGQGTYGLTVGFDENVLFVFDAGTSGENISSALVEEENEAGGTTAVIG